MVLHRWLLLGFWSLSTLTAADTYAIDPVHSEVGFRIRHLVSKTAGRFTRFEGRILMDEKDWSKSSVDVRIQTDSINTDNEARDKHLRQPDFFDTGKYPQMTYKSRSVKEIRQGQLEIQGDLTLKGVTRPISLRVQVLGTAENPMDKSLRAGFEASATLKRSEFTLNAYPKLLGEDVEITLNIEAIKQKNNN